MIQKRKKMQGRITFPIYNQFGTIISICGRTIYDEKPKSLNFQDAFYLYSLIQYKLDRRKNSKTN